MMPTPKATGLMWVLRHSGVQGTLVTCLYFSSEDLMRPLLHITITWGTIKKIHLHPRPIKIKSDLGCRKGGVLFLKLPG